MKEKAKELLKTVYVVTMCVVLFPLAFIAMLDDEKEVDTDDYL